MLAKALKCSTFLFAATLMSSQAHAATHAGKVYGPQPVTVKGYSGDKTNSVSYSGQIARYVLHDSLKKLAGKGNGGENAAELEAQMMAYFGGSEAPLDIVAPLGKDGFPLKQTCLLYTSPSPRDRQKSRMPSSA